MPAWDDAATGVKLVTIRPENRTRDLPTIQGLYVLFDGPTGTPCALLDGGALTHRRTAAASALAARYLARPDSSHHLVIGAGALAGSMVEAMASVLPVTRVTIWNRTPARAEALARRLRDHGFPAEWSEDLPAAVAAADVVTTATQSPVPLVRRADVRPGTHLDLVGAYRPDMAEAEPALLSSARIVVDTVDGAESEAGDLLQAIEAGFLTWEDISGDLSELVRGAIRPRRGSDEITVFKSVGASIEDLAAARLVWERHQ